MTWVLLLKIAAALCIAWNVFAFITLKTAASCVVATWVVVVLIVLEVRS